MRSLDELKKRLSYDPETGVFTRLFSGNPHATSRWKGREAGWLTGNGYVMIAVEQNKYQAHRLAWLWMTGEWPTADIDHINGFRIDNRACNLRQVSRQQNLQNQHKASRNNLCGLLGVSPKRDKFQARIMVDRKTIRLGVYDTAEAAHAAYLAGKRRLHPGGTL